MQLKVKKPFAWAHRGVQVEEFSEGQVIDCQDADLQRVALSEGWAEPVADSANQKARKGAPENKSVG